MHTVHDIIPRAEILFLLYLSIGGFSFFSYVTVPRRRRRTVSIAPLGPQDGVTRTNFAVACVFASRAEIVEVAVA